MVDSEPSPRWPGSTGSSSEPRIRNPRARIASRPIVRDWVLTVREIYMVSIILSMDYKAF